MSAYSLPLPTVSRWSRPFWDACRKHELMIQRCKECNRLIMYPKLYCPECLSDDMEWIKASGHGKIYSYTVVTNNPPSVFADQLPYVVAIVELDEGVRLATNVVDTPVERLACDTPVEVVFDDVTEELTLPKFRVSAEPGTNRNGAR